MKDAKHSEIYDIAVVSVFSVNYLLGEAKIAHNFLLPEDSYKCLDDLSILVQFSKLI